MNSNRVIKMSKAWIAALVVGVALTGCGGGGSGSGSGNRTDSSGNGSSSGYGGSGVAALSWVAPATRVNGDGISMGELQGYIIRFGQNSGNLSESIRVNDASVMDYTISGLRDGEWFFAVQVVDNAGLISAPSKVVSKSI